VSKSITRTFVESSSTFLIFFDDDAYTRSRRRVVIFFHDDARDSTSDTTFRSMHLKVILGLYSPFPFTLSRMPDGAVGTENHTRLSTLNRTF